MLAILHDYPDLKLFSKSYKILDFFSKQYNKTPSLLHASLIKGDDYTVYPDDDVPRSHLNFDIGTIQEIAHSFDRFNEISVVIVDYDLPIMNGLGLVKELKVMLKDLPVKFIMLTGKADEKIAVEAFNNELIDQFVLKGKDYPEHIRTAVQALQLQYFQDLSEMIVKSLSKNQTCCLNDPDFFAYFQASCQEHHIVEYYLIDNLGSFLMIDQKGQIYWLVIKSEKDMDNFLELFIESDSEDPSPKEMAEAIQKKQKILFVPSIDDYGFDSAKAWAPYLYSVEPFKLNNKTYYRAFIKDSGKYENDTRPIASYWKFVQNQ